MKTSLLYHYTSQDGLLGILRTGSIWASSILHLNDSSESRYIFRVATDALRTKEHAARGGDREAERILYTLLRSEMERVSAFPKVRHYVACFSDDDDSLLQWRLYCQPASGYALGFNSDVLSSLGSGVQLMRCEYKNALEAVEPIINSFAKDFRGRVPPSVQEIASMLVARNLEGELGRRREYWEPMRDLVLQLSELAPRFKDPDFEHERESRIVTEGTGQKVHFRAGKSVSIPYVELSLPKRRDLISRVVIGPTYQNRWLIEQTIATLFRECKLKKPEIAMSTKPFRAW